MDCENTQRVVYGGAIFIEVIIDRVELEPKKDAITWWNPGLVKLSHVVYRTPVHMKEEQK
jgi:hypothetical protein